MSMNTCFDAVTKSCLLLLTRATLVQITDTYFVKHQQLRFPTRLSRFPVCINAGTATKIYHHSLTCVTMSSIVISRLGVVFSVWLIASVVALRDNSERKDIVIDGNFSDWSSASENGSSIVGAKNVVINGDFNPTNFGDPRSIIEETKSRAERLYERNGHYKPESSIATTSMKVDSDGSANKEKVSDVPGEQRDLHHQRKSSDVHKSSVSVHSLQSEKEKPKADGVVNKHTNEPTRRAGGSIHIDGKDAAPVNDVTAESKGADTKPAKSATAKATKHRASEDIASRAGNNSIISEIQAINNVRGNVRIDGKVASTRNGVTHTDINDTIWNVGGKVHIGTNHASASPLSDVTSELHKQMDIDLITKLTEEE